MSSRIPTFLFALVLALATPTLRPAVAADGIHRCGCFFHQTTSVQTARSVCVIYEDAGSCTLRTFAPVGPGPLSTYLSHDLERATAALKDVGLAVDPLERLKAATTETSNQWTSETIAATTAGLLAFAVVSPTANRLKEIHAFLRVYGATITPVFTGMQTTDPTKSIETDRFRVSTGRGCLVLAEDRFVAAISLPEAAQSGGCSLPR